MRKVKPAILAMLTALNLTMVSTPFIQPSNNIANIQAATINISKSKLTLYQGDTYKLKITGTTKTVKWTSSKTSVATVSSTGKVTAKKKGTTTVTATVDGKKYTCKVTVTTKYIDGTYEGTGIGYRNGTTKVSVTVKNDVITDVKIVSNEDTPRFFEYASTQIIGEILDAQSYEVDTVSGATYSSNGIMNAVENALSKARR
ncbi:MAG TPA: FMN-binding protein [Lachnospiraceae bacterium]|nr:FMN-binding protein [Lachnospiraceae bacterium]